MDWINLAVLLAVVGGFAGMRRVRMAPPLVTTSDRSTLQETALP